MSEASNTNATPTPEANGSGVITTPQPHLSVEERAAALFGGEGLPGAEGDVTEPAKPQPDAIAKGRADRRAALAQLQERERGRVDAQAAIRERDELRAKLAAMQAAPAAPPPSHYIDPSKLTKEQYFDLARKLPDLTPYELGEFIREQTANPELAAARAAATAVDPKLTALEKRIADQQAKLDAWEQQQADAREQAEEQHAAEQFFGFTRENAAAAPFSARFLEKHGPQEFYKLARSVVSDVPQHGGAQAILDEIEERLTSLGSVFMPETTLQRKQANTPPETRSAAQGPTTISNTLAQQRSSVVDENADFRKLSIEERAARIFGT